MSVTIFDIIYQLYPDANGVTNKEGVYQAYDKDGDTWPVTTIFCADPEDAQVVKEWLNNEKEICEEHF